jgi:hypothetical protein
MPPGSNSSLAAVRSTNSRTSMKWPFEITGHYIGWGSQDFGKRLPTPPHERPATRHRRAQGPDYFVGRVLRKRKCLKLGLPPILLGVNTPIHSLPSQSSNGCSSRIFKAALLAAARSAAANSRTPIKWPSGPTMYARKSGIAVPHRLTRSVLCHLDRLIATDLRSQRADHTPCTKRSLQHASMMHLRWPRSVRVKGMDGVCSGSSPTDIPA